MGRRAKYLTNDERASAHREENARYYQHASAQVVHAASHRAHYVNRTCGLEYQRPMRCIPHLPPLSQEIHRLHQKRLPVSAVLYQDVLNGDDIVLSNEALPRWMAKPPFLMDKDETDPYSADYRFWTECLEAIIHGYRMCLQLEDDRQCRLDLAAKGWVVFMDVLREEVVQLLRNWETVNICSIRKLYVWATGTAFWGLLEPRLRRGSSADLDTPWPRQKDAWYQKLLWRSSQDLAVQ
ncbi:hypothetical protein B0H14DRAFT_2583989 [Mycena olivaceomarginata]|nr:hypothetical protein B0H14DRAFT_2583989 [Mycena olivaceomarginata]